MVEAEVEAVGRQEWIKWKNNGEKTRKNIQFKYAHDIILLLSVRHFNSTDYDYIISFLNSILFWNFLSHPQTISTTSSTPSSSNFYYNCFMSILKVIQLHQQKKIELKRWSWSLSISRARILPEIAFSNSSLELSGWTHEHARLFRIDFRTRSPSRARFLQAFALTNTILKRSSGFGRFQFPGFDSRTRSSFQILLSNALVFSG